MAEYLPVVGGLEANAERHYANARRHEREGRPEYAAGSLRKGDRNLSRARVLREAVAMPPFLEEAINRVSAVIANTIMEG